MAELGRARHVVEARGGVLAQASARVAVGQQVAHLGRGVRIASVSLRAHKGHVLRLDCGRRARRRVLVHLPQRCEDFRRAAYGAIVICTGMRDGEDKGERGEAQRVVVAPVVNVRPLEPPRGCRRH